CGPDGARPWFLTGPQSDSDAGDSGCAARLSSTAAEDGCDAAAGPADIVSYEAEEPGTGRSFYVCTAPVVRSDGPPGVLVAMLDISPRIHAERRLRELNGELDAFSYAVSHELRAPLRHIDGFVRLLRHSQGEVIDPRGRGFLDRIERAVCAQRQLIDDLLRLSRCSQKDIEVAAVDLSAMAGEIVAELRHSEPAPPAEVHIAPGLIVAGDDSLLRIALYNLLHNAWKYSGERALRRIAITGERPAPGQLAVHIVDNGAGFAPDCTKFLFEPFRRLHESSRFVGTGIGLAAVKRIAVRHGGTVSGSSDGHSGARFVMTLPVGESG
ncbi:MAG: ATP-binding protein, partial [Myxococcota bacterium]